MLKSDLLKYFGKRVEKLRTEKNLSQIDLAAKMEGSIDITNISRIENGRTNPTLLTLYRLSKALEISISELLDFEYNTTSKGL